MANTMSISYQFSDEGRTDAAAVMETGRALGTTAFERGDRLTKDERDTLGHWSMFGSAGYPIVKIGRSWMIDHPAFSAASLYRTKSAAYRAWKVMIAKWICMSGLEAYESVS